jgi:hypothetical protein
VGGESNSSCDYGINIAGMVPVFLVKRAVKDRGIKNQFVSQKKLPPLLAGAVNKSTFCY